jgi:drug/metabolite transporter (DMT)-like permease
MRHNAKDILSAPAGSRRSGIEETAIDPVAIALVLVAAVTHASWNRLLHAEGDRVAAVAVAGLAVGVLLLPGIVIWPPWAALPFVLLSAALETVYALCLTAAYQRGALSIAYPLGRGVAPLLVTLGGWLVLTQRPDAGALLGAALLALGLGAIAVAGGRAGQSAAVGFALLTGVTIAAYSVVDAAAVREVSPIGYLGAVMAIEGAALTTIVRGDCIRLRGSLRPGILIAVGILASYLLVLFAFQLAPAGRVSTLRESSVLISLFLARERPAPVVWFGAIFVVAGALLAAG